MLRKNSLLFDDRNIILSSNNVFHYLSKKNNEKFDIIFADPPYQSTDFLTLLNGVKPLLKPKGIFCMEMKKQNLENIDVRIKHYGNTQVIFWKENV